LAKVYTKEAQLLPERNVEWQWVVLAFEFINSYFVASSDNFFFFFIIGFFEWLEKCVCIEKVPVSNCFKIHTTMNLNRSRRPPI
jgi:hypothetical protein